MKLDKVKEIIKEVYPKIEKYYGFSKFMSSETPYVETHYNIYARHSGEPEAEGEQDDCHAEYDRTDNSIVIYYPNMVSREHIIQTLVHEYQHYLQSPSWFKRYYDMGYGYNDHPYEVQAYAEEKNWELFN
jgi:hypothetical protein|tara:strand:- start:343 stop:732 length:390 start_codon:yes stop_codon:yes gene_type:complete